MCQKLTRTSITWIALLILMSGCDDRATQIAREAADRQALQNTAMAALQEEVAQGSRELVAQDAAARQDFVGVHRDLQAERTRLDTGWQALEVERNQVARRRRTESLLVPAMQAASGLALITVLLGFCWYALARLRTGDTVDADLNALLVERLLTGDGQEAERETLQPVIPNMSVALPKLH